MYEYNLGFRFENIVEQYGQKPALKFSKNKVISYQKLNYLVNQLARFLLKQGIRTSDVVCLAGIKNVNSYACMLACLKIGAIFSVLDHSSPTERLGRIITTCLPKVLVIPNNLKQSLTGVIKKNKIKTLNSYNPVFRKRIKHYAKTNLDITQKIVGSNPAYIMFTSGSTGFPKGALITHQNLLNLIFWSIEEYSITPQDILTNVNPLYFDNSIFDFAASLFSGACLAPITKKIITKPTLLVKKIDELRCTQWFSVPSLLIYLDTMKVLKKNNLKYIKKIIFGGEGYPKTKLKHLHSLYGKKSKIFNVYGPTECTCICSSYQVTSKDFENLNGLPPLGKLAKNFSYLILDDKEKEVGSDKIGELCLLGPNLGKGYYNNPQKTQEQFVQNPLEKNYQEYIYKTGDLVRYNFKDGHLYFIGRKDNQIKHMGYRIELDEIEAALNRLHNISESAVVHGYIKELSQIIAIVSTKKTTEEEVVKRDLKSILPNYMIPNKIYFKKPLPKNANGKIDRKKLTQIYCK